MEDTELSVEAEHVLRAMIHELRRKILFLLKENSTQSYTELLSKLTLSTGKLNFHLKKLVGIIEKQDDGLYVLTKVGDQAVKILEQIDSIIDNKEQAELLRKISISTSLKQITPAKETKKKWYFWITIIYFLSVWLPLAITEIVVDLQFLQILTNNTAQRISVYCIILLGIILVLVVLSGILAKMYLERISYEIMDTEITIRKGLFVKTRTIIPFRTITNLVIKQGPIDFILGISNIIIQTAGESAKAEPEGLMIGIYYAKDLIEEILNLVRLLDPPSYLKEKVGLSSSSKNITLLYSEILNELENIDEKLSK
ncbi:MAG: PH domain-containing protein [Candidatus Heimdallarchaeota archaeon]